MTIVEAELKLMLPHNLSHIVIDDVKGERSPLRITPVEQVLVRESVIDACGYRPIPPPVRLRAIEIRGYQRVNVRQSRQWRDAEQIFGQRALTSRIDHVQLTLVGDLLPLPRL